MTSFSKTSGLVFAVALFSLGLAAPGAALAKPASNLVCKGCVDNRDIKNNAVTVNKIKNNSVSASKIKDNSVSSKKIKNGSISPADLHLSAKPAGADMVETTDDFDLSPTNVDVVTATVTVSAPGPGVIIATGNLYADFHGVSGRFACSLATSTAIGGQYALAAADEGIFPVSRTRAFVVGAAGNLTINFICREVSGDLSVHRPNLVAWYVPGKY